MGKKSKTSPKYETYKKNKTREKNKIKKIMRHLKKHPNNQRMWERIRELKQQIGL